MLCRLFCPEKVMSCRRVVPLKAWSPMAVTFSPRVTLMMWLQPRNAPLAIVKLAAGSMVTLVRSTLLENAPSPNVLIPAGSDTFLSPVEEKA